MGCGRRYFDFRFFKYVSDGEDLFPLVRNNEIDDCNGVSLVDHSSNEMTMWF